MMILLTKLTFLLNIYRNIFKQVFFLVLLFLTKLPLLLNKVKFQT